MLTTMDVGVDLDLDVSVGWRDAPPCQHYTAGKRTHETHADFLLLTTPCGCGVVDVAVCEVHGHRMGKAGRAWCSRCGVLTDVLGMAAL